MAIHFIGLNRETLLKDYKYLYRFTTLDKFIEILNSNSFTFINPSLWTDPYEKFYLERDFIINKEILKLPAKDKVFAVCFSGTISSEAYWKVYAPKEDGVRVTFDTKKLLDNFLSKIKNADIFIGKVNYQIMDDFNKISSVRNELVDEINRKIVGEQQIKLLLKKRRSFLYEDEIRIIIVPLGKINENKIYKVQTDITEFTTKYMIDHRFGRSHFNALREYLFTKYDIKISISRLFKEQNRDPINLTD